MTVISALGNNTEAASGTYHTSPSVLPRVVDRVGLSNVAARLVARWLLSDTRRSAFTELDIVANGLFANHVARLTNNSVTGDNVGRPERPLDPEAGELERFALDLRHLRTKAGGPTYRHLARRAHFSVTTLAKAASGDTVPSLQVTLAYVAACDGDLAEWTERWHSLIASVTSAETTEVSRGPYWGMAALPAGGLRMVLRTRAHGGPAV